MELRIEPCSRTDLDRLLSQDMPPHVAAHHRERFALQSAGTATYLLAWRAERNVGRATIYSESKYEAVRSTHPGTVEINALEAEPRRQGIGTALIATAESLAVRWGHRSIGLAVEPSNPDARRLYERLGYVPWGVGLVIDEWVEQRDGDEAVLHQDPCDYLIKHLGDPDAH